MQKLDKDRLFIWANVLAYFITWVAVSSGGFQLKLLAPAFLVSLVYVGALYYEMAVRGHVWLSTDATALPAAFAATAIGGVAAWLYGIEAMTILNFVFGVLKAWLAAHAVMFVLVYISDKLGWG